MREDSLAADLRSIGARFEISGELVAERPHGHGLIHDTFLAEYGGSGDPGSFILQRVNRVVFNDPVAVCENIARVTDHIREKCIARGVPDLDRRCLRLIPARDGRAYARDDAGEVWRAFRFIEGTRALDELENGGQAFEAARAFGAFAADLVDLPGPSLTVTIPDFHDLGVRLAQLREAERADSHGRRRDVAAEIEAASNLEQDLDRALAASEFAALPRRVMHNDCKVNNVLLDANSGEGLCVIDLDTVMDGTVVCDFGDLVRSGSCRAPKDAREARNLSLDLDLFEGLAAGYLAGADFLTELEKGILPLAGPVLAFETGIRFLADHLSGDAYFRTERAGQNLGRARGQLQLARSMLLRQDEIRAAFERAAAAST